MTEPVPARVRLDLYSSSFCGACSRTRSVLSRVTELVPSVEVIEHDVAQETDRAVADGIHTTPTVIVHAPSGAESFRAGSVPTISQVLTAVARALDDIPAPAGAGEKGGDGGI